MTVVDIVAARDDWTRSEFARFTRDHAWQGELDLLRKDGSAAQVDVSANAANVASGDVFVAVIQEAEREQRWRIERFQETLTDLQASLDPIVSLTGALLREGSAGRTQVDEARSAAQYLLRGLDNLASAVAIDHGRWVPEPALVDLTEIADVSIERALSHQRGQKLSVLAPRGTLIGLWDPALLSRIFDELLGLAIARCSPDGTVQVTITDSGPDVVVGISDEGPALSPWELQAIFMAPKAAFALRLDLYVTHRLVEEQGGRMWAQSDNVHGTTCYFSLPRQGIAVSGRIAG
jgi:two-component system sensor histidine kinase VicK